jgi:hypothetical protein
VFVYVHHLGEQVPKDHEVELSGKPKQVTWERVGAILMFRTEVIWFSILC